MKNIEINAGLKVVKLDGEKFKYKTGFYICEGFALKHEELGFVSFDGILPYRPHGGKKALTQILKDGGFLEFDTIKFLKPTQD